MGIISRRITNHKYITNFHIIDRTFLFYYKQLMIHLIIGIFSIYPTEDRYYCIVHQLLACKRLIILQTSILGILTILSCIQRLSNGIWSINSTRLRLSTPLSDQLNSEYHFQVDYRLSMYYNITLRRKKIKYNTS